MARVINIEHMIARYKAHVNLTPCDVKFSAEIFKKSYCKELIYRRYLLACVKFLVHDYKHLATLNLQVHNIFSVKSIGVCVFN